MVTVAQTWPNFKYLGCTGFALSPLFQGCGARFNERLDSRS